MVYMPYDASRFRTVHIAPPRAQPPAPARRNFAELVQDMRGFGDEAFVAADELLDIARDPRMRARIQAVMTPLLALQLAATQLSLTLNLAQRTAPPTVPLEPGLAPGLAPGMAPGQAPGMAPGQEPREPGRMSLPNLPPMPHTVRPHREGWRP